MQAVKSLSWTLNKRVFKDKVKKRVENQLPKFKAGSLALLEALLGKNKMVSFKFAIVQPGISKTSFSPKLSFVLAAADDSIRNNGNDPMIVIGS